ncbi:DUF2730 family protein [Megalodesulfovibrio gigas]|uniref:DUF2730 family protein n=1 Tax=Megalodesulfovibrio gigas (strain ATCC 19364 / DSM 1382 / NCIMB 9332 / VKM B-1759) TaxID=1121448 RepID=T2G9M0_MEGG1|nr:DUF2730 family protein [Megalodesulfovibrio gigas]AGW12826.1 hypothetical protein DGI_0939 [Megalodesulfovibrio gigas DSM 1382 = ATCC 19364]
MSWDAVLAKFMPWALLLVQALFGWAMWSLRKEFVRKDDHSLSCSSLAQRLVAVEQHLDRMPTAEQWQQLQVAIEEMRGGHKVVLAKLEGQGEVLKRIEHPVHLLMEHHLRGDK